MNGMVITGSLTDDFYKFIEAKIGDSQGGEQGFYLLGEQNELKVEADVKQKGETAGALAVVAIALEILKDVGIEVAAGLLVEFIRSKIKSRQETPEGLEKKLIITTTGRVRRIEMTNYSPEEIKMLKSMLK